MFRLKSGQAAVDSAEDRDNAIPNWELWDGNMALKYSMIAAVGLLFAALDSPAKADVVLGGPDSNDGSYSTTALAGLAATDGTVSAAGVTGISLWAFLGGANASSSTSPFYGAITTSTPSGDNAKNSILRYYLVATNATGQQSVVSLGEIDPNFGGTASPAPFIAYTNTGGTQLSQPSLIVPSQQGRDLTNVTSLQIMSVAAAPTGPGGLSTAVQLSGDVSAPGTYTQTDLQNDFTPVNETVSGDTYTGVPLWTFLNSPDPGSTNQIVTIEGTDGLEVAVALAELDPTLGAVPCGPGVTTCDILPYADTGTNFTTGGDGVARTIFPTDNAHGRWVSNVESITVEEVPEPGSLTLFGVAAAAIGIVQRRTRRRRAAAI
jgi:hypothetical protein